MSLSALIYRFVWNDPYDKDAFRGMLPCPITEENGVFSDYLSSNIITVHGHVGGHQKSLPYVKGHGEFINSDNNFAKPGVSTGSVPVTGCSTVSLEEFKKIEANKHIAIAEQKIRDVPSRPKKVVLPKTLNKIDKALKSVDKRLEYLRVLQRDLQKWKNLAEEKAVDSDDQLTDKVAQWSRIKADLEVHRKPFVIRRKIIGGVAASALTAAPVGYFVYKGVLFESTALTTVNTITGTQAVTQLAISAAVGGLVFAAGVALVATGYFLSKGEYMKAGASAGLSVAFGVTAVLAPYIGLGLLALVGLALLIKKSYNYVTTTKETEQSDKENNQLVDGPDRTLSTT